ncbi:MAG: metallophosphoesterase [Brevinematales bacterium]|nr:metallophosphoesterase [Brevinematales bacterium]
MNLILIFLLIIAIIAYLETFFVQVKKLEISTEKMENNYSFLLISDLHFHKGFTDLKLKILRNTIFNLLKKQKVDIIFFTGDFIDNQTGLNKLSKFIEEFKNIKCYGVFGNHDYWDYNILHFLYPIFSKIDKKPQDIKELKKILEKKVKILINEKIEYKEFIIYGLDYNSIDPKFDFSDKKFKILLSHYPEVIYLYKDKVDLILAGHTHGGQLTFFGIPIVVRSKLRRKWIRGISKHNNTTLVVTKGVGESFYIPFRFFSRPEVVLIELRGGKDEV